MCNYKTPCLQEMLFDNIILLKIGFIQNTSFKISFQKNFYKINPIELVWFEKIISTVIIHTGFKHTNV